ncbi:Shugoshin [Tolypocladium ophioglossoides CBS 100239]|uniref:Shugoshin n=1 Tax=Tolypocladium ophioglossoides (strain CBS 100239) TaxID=1163406 RepID=A0A0L0NK85_TOLOC|nr:Shugoshin [Tolypocladium ophioglossoides CBS 100239]
MRRSLTHPPPVRRKMLRQNRDLAKSNNIRALRIRELENECACMLSENLELRGRILELEQQVQDNEARRIADHALAIKAKLEAQLTEWGTLLAGLGLEPPMKRHSPRIRKSIKQRMSFSANRLSPSQRRLRDVARDIEELGHISENKSCPRPSMKYAILTHRECEQLLTSGSPVQILALRAEADSTDSTDSPELGPPPMSKFIDEDPVKVDSPTRVAPIKIRELSPKRKMEPPVSLASPKHEEVEAPPPPSPEKKSEPIVKLQQSRLQPAASTEPRIVPQPINTGAKRKFAARDDAENIPIQRMANENQPPRGLSEKQSIRDKAGGKTLKELAGMRKEARDKQGATSNARKPLAAKSTNDDISSPKKMTKPAMTDKVAAAKADLIKGKASNERSKSKARTNPPATMEAAPVPDIPPTTTIELAPPFVEPALLSPSSPEAVPADNGHRGDTPPPADITSRGETTRPSRRNRTAISYAEPNLRDKMRRPTKELFDAVAGDGKYPRQSSQAEPLAPQMLKVKRESDTGETWKTLPAASEHSAEAEPGSIPESPLANKSSSPEDLPDTVVTDRRRRPSSMASKAAGPADEGSETVSQPKDTDASLDTSGLGEPDIYEFTSSSPQIDKEDAATKKTGRRQTTSSRRISAAVNNDKEVGTKDRNTSRRRSMMV